MQLQPTYTDTHIYRVCSESCLLSFIGETSAQFRYLHPECKTISVQTVLIFPAVPG